jgi:hypothetical protein
VSASPRHQWTPTRLSVVVAALVTLGVGVVVGATPASAAGRSHSSAAATVSSATSAPLDAAPTPTSTTVAGSLTTSSLPTLTPKTARQAARAQLSTATTSTTSTTTISTSTSTTTSTTEADPDSPGTTSTPTGVPTAAVDMASFRAVKSGRHKVKKVRTASVVVANGAPIPHRASVRQADTVAAAAAAALSPPTAVTVPAGIADDCSVDVSRPLAGWLNSLPAGSRWAPAPSACFLINHGEQIQFPADLTIDGGTFEDLNTTSPTQNGAGTQAGHPAFEIEGGADVKLENMTIVGAHNGWSYRPSLAFQAGIQLDGTEGAAIDNVSVTKTFGDGLNLEPLRGGSDYRSGGIVNPVENLSVDTLTIRQTGRQGITPASVNGATFTNVHISGVAFDAFDFEADQRTEGAKNVTINGCTFSGINISMQGPATGPITVTDCTMPKTNRGDAIRIENTGGKPFSGPVVFTNDVLRCAASVYVSCIELGGASNVAVQNSTVTIGFHRDAIHEAAYTANHGSHVVFTDDVVNGFGHVGMTNDGSTATVSGGTWTGKSCHWPAVCPAR